MVYIIFNYVKVSCVLMIVSMEFYQFYMPIIFEYIECLLYENSGKEILIHLQGVFYSLPNTYCGYLLIESML